MPTFFLLSLMNSGDTAMSRQYFMKAVELDKNAEYAKKNIELLNQTS